MFFDIDPTTANTLMVWANTLVIMWCSLREPAE